MRRAKIIGVIIEKGDAGLYHATSPDMKDLLVSGETVEDVKEAVPAVIAAIYEAYGENVNVVEAEERAESNSPFPWVVLPGKAEN